MLGNIRYVKEQLAGVIDLLLADTRATSPISPEVHDYTPNEGPDDTQSAMLVWPDGSIASIYITTTLEFSAGAVQVAEQFQSELILVLWSHDISSTWPDCPVHPNAHPLKPDASGAAPEWICPTDLSPVARIGGLR
jgi:hypothetical protein